jgi:hypothetical protein
LFVDNDDRPYIVFCHEWVQIKDGSFAVRPLKRDLSGPDGEAVTLFHASEAPWVKGVDGNYISDGLFLYRCNNGTLLLLWASSSKSGYTEGVSLSVSGSIHGPWRHSEVPLYAEDGGHGMIFQGFDQTHYLALHAPNSRYCEHPLFLPIKEEKGMLYLVN